MKRLLSFFVIFCFMTVFCAPFIKSDAVGETLRFRSDGKFKIVVFADCQDDSSPDSRMINFMNVALDVEKPDLVVFPGDNVVVSTTSAFEKGANALLRPIVDRNIPYAITFGNHDSEKGPSKSSQLSIYQRIGKCLTYNADDSIYGYGNCNLPIYSSKSQDIAFNLWMIDSNMYESTGKYDHVHQDQLDWFVRTDTALERSQGHKVNSIVFQHIIMPECVNLLVEGNNGKSTRSYYGKTYSLELNGNARGYLGEFPCPPATNGGEFSVLKSRGDVLGVVTGHDHSNSFIGTYQGIDFIQTPGMSFESYGDENARGYRVIELDENDTSTYITNTIKYTEMALLQYQNLSFTNNDYYYRPSFGKYISDITVESDDNADNALNRLRDAGYYPVSFDLNTGARGKYIFMGYKVTNNYDEAIKDIRFLSEPYYVGVDYLTIKINGKSCVYNRIDTDLNKGSGGNYVYFMYSKDSFSGPAIQSISFSTSTTMAGMKVAGIFNSPNSAADLNKGTSTHETGVYCFTQSTDKLDISQLKNYYSSFKNFTSADGFTQSSLADYSAERNKVSSYLESVQATRVSDLNKSEIAEMAASFAKSYDMLSSADIVDDSVWGFAPHLNENEIKSYFNPDSEVTFESKNGFLGTGSRVTVTNGSRSYNFTAVVFGDTNGDSWYDGTDAVLVSCIVSGMFTKEQVGEAVWKAADCNHDGAIDEADIEILQQAGLLLASIDQSKSAEELQTDSAYAEYVNLIDQTPDDKPIEKTNFIQLLIDIIVKIFNYIKLYFAILK